MQNVEINVNNIQKLKDNPSIFTRVRMWTDRWPDKLKFSTLLVNDKKIISGK